MVIPYQWDALNDRIPEAEPSMRLKTFALPQDCKTVNFTGCVSGQRRRQMAGSGSLVAVPKPDAELEKTADEVIELVASASAKMAISILTLR